MSIETKYWPAESPGTGIEEAAAAIAAGGVVAFPTETVYGLGGGAGSTEAVRRIFAAKGRPSDNPLIVHLARRASVAGLAKEIGAVEAALMDAFWPGPLTLVLPVREGAVSPLVTAGLDTVAVRVPAHELARELIERAGCPIAAPSANRSGRPSPTLARHVLEDLDGRIDGVLDGGATGVGLESTVVRVVDGTIHILRPGGITREQLRQAAEGLADVAEEAMPAEAGAGMTAEGRAGMRAIDGGAGTTTERRSGATDGRAGTAGTAGIDRGAGTPSGEAPRSPGVKYAHYAPRGEMLLVTGAADRLPAIVQEQALQAADAGRRVAVLSCAEHVALYRADAVFDCGPRGEPEKAAQSLYATLRECDERAIDFIVAEGYPEDGIGAALMNRMRKAAGGRELSVR
ncbi:L-threonylcarbamoyladenylate synthase [Cohnella sp.]|uniref:L-threonylcarbamoyladenylate synthase n=1 Tax=Cohnella sp. TaxID=1883426 RepID=UPI003562401E